MCTAITHLDRLAWVGPRPISYATDGSYVYRRSKTGGVHLFDVAPRAAVIGTWAPQSAEPRVLAWAPPHWQHEGWRPERWATAWRYIHPSYVAAVVETEVDRALHYGLVSRYNGTAVWGLFDWTSCTRAMNAAATMHLEKHLDHDHDATKPYTEELVTRLLAR